MEFDIEVIEAKSYGSDDSVMNAGQHPRPWGGGEVSRTYGSRSPNAKMTTNFLERES